MDDNKNEELNNNEKENNIETINESEETVEVKKKNRILPIIAGVLAGIVAVAFIVLVVMSLLSPKNKFFSLVGGAFSGVSHEVAKLEDSVLGEIFTLDMNSKLTADIKMSGKIETEDLEIKEWVQNLESFELNTKEDIDFSNDYNNTNAEFILNGEKFLTGSLIQNKNIISAKLDNITDGYITVDNNNLASLWEKLGYNGPESLIIQSDILKNFNFSKSDINNLKGVVKAFGNGFSSAFDDEDFSYGEGTVSYDEGTIECKSMDFVVNPIQLNEGLIKGLEKVVSKEKYIDALYKVISTLDRVSGYEPLSREEFGTNFELMIQEMYAIEFSEEDPGFIIRIYYTGNDIVKIEMLSEDYNTKMLEFIAVNNKDSGYYKFFDGMIIYEDKVSTIDNITTHMLNINYINYETGEVEEGYGSEINITIDNTVKNEESINLIEKARLLSYDMDFSNLDIMSIEPTVIRNYTLKGKVDGDINNLEVRLTDSDNDFSSTFFISATVKENAEFEYITVPEDENFDVSTKTDEEIINKKDKIIENWNSTAGSDKTKTQQFEAAISMYLGMFISVNDFFGTDEYYEEINTNYADLEELE